MSEVSTRGTFPPGPAAPGQSTRCWWCTQPTRASRRSDSQRHSGGRLASLASNPASPRAGSSHLVNNSVSNDSAGPRLALPPYLSEPAPESGRFTSVAFARAGQVPRHPGGYATFAAPNPRGYEPAGEGCVAFSSRPNRAFIRYCECCLLAGDDRAPDFSRGSIDGLCGLLS